MQTVRSGNGNFLLEHCISPTYRFSVVELKSSGGSTLACIVSASFNRRDARRAQYSPLLAGVDR